MNFTKLFSSILDSTIWQESKETKIVWVTMLAMCDRHGEIHASIPGLAVRSGVTIPECETALLCLLSPDHYSRTKDHDGRRIAEIDGGWVLLNHGKYRALLSAEERREYNRIKQQQHRANKSLTVNDNKQCQHITEAEADAKETQKHRVAAAPRSVFRKPTVQDVIDYVREISATVDAKDFVDFYESNGWKVGRNAMKDWKATVRQWHSRSKKLPQQAVSAIKPEQSPEFIKAFNAARSYPQDYEARQRILGPDLFEALKRTGTPRVANANDFELKTLAASFMEHLKDIRNGIAVSN